MPYCPECGNQLTGSEPHCPACGQPTDSPPPLLEPSPARTPESLPLGDYFKTGWGLFKQYPGGFVGFCLLYLVIQAALHSIPYVGAVAVVCRQHPAAHGQLYRQRQTAARANPRISRLFRRVSVLFAAAAAFPGSWPLYRHRDDAVDYPGGLSGSWPICLPRTWWLIAVWTSGRPWS